MSTNQSINDIMRNSFPFLQEILSPAQLVTTFQIYVFLPPQILAGGSHSVRSKKYNAVREKQIYIINHANQVITMVPNGKVTSLDRDVHELSMEVGVIIGYLVEHTELLYQTILDHLDSNIQYVVVVEAEFRIEEFDKKSHTRIVEIFGVDPDTLETDCKKVKTELDLRKRGIRPRDLN